MAKKPRTVNTTFRIDEELRNILESIAVRESRSLSGQMTLFLRRAVNSYMEENCLKYYSCLELAITEEEYAEYMASRIGTYPPETNNS